MEGYCDEVIVINLHLFSIFSNRFSAYYLFSVHASFCLVVAANKHELMS